MTLILHTCCAPCSAAIIEWLLCNGMTPVLFFYNPNIYPQSEYILRRNEVVNYAKKIGVEIIEGDDNYIGWLEQVSGLEHEPERGARCLQCFKIRMLATARLANVRHISMFATSLAASRQKNIEQIAQAGHWAAAHFCGLQFFQKNWRKGGLNEQRYKLLKENNFYNQRYCGCNFKSQNI